MKHLLFAGFIFLYGLQYSDAQQNAVETQFRSTGSHVEHSSPVVVLFNESSKVINVAFKDPVSGVEEMSVYNILGNALYDLQMERIGDKVFLIDAHTLQPGFYFIKIKTKKVEHIERITIRPGTDQFSISRRDVIPTLS